MKSTKSLLVIFAVAVVVASCATTQNTSGEGYDENNRTTTIGNRVYVDDPFYGRVVLERDPYNGRYYDVTNGYRGLSSPYNGLNNYRRYGNYNRNYRNYRNNTIRRDVQQPSREPVQKNREEARKKILGNSN